MTDEGESFSEALVGIKLLVTCILLALFSTSLFVFFLFIVAPFTIGYILPTGVYPAFIFFFGTFFIVKIFIFNFILKRTFRKIKPIIT